MDECVDDKHTYIIVQNTKLGVSKTCNTMYTNPTICLYIFNDYYYFISKKKKDNTITPPPNDDKDNTPEYAPLQQPAEQ
jgi:uncharacterized membrane protein YukC